MPIQGGRFESSLNAKWKNSNSSWMLVSLSSLMASLHHRLYDACDTAERIKTQMMKRCKMTWEDRPFKLWHQLPDPVFLSVFSLHKPPPVLAKRKSVKVPHYPQMLSPAKGFANLALMCRRCSSLELCSQHRGLSDFAVTRSPSLTQILHVSCQSLFSPETEAEVRHWWCQMIDQAVHQWPFSFI